MALKYRGEIDGLRALAVVPVILNHAGSELFSGGYVGVDVFFVISGYLITTIILNDIAVGNFSPLNFYSRRARRILPALFLVTLVSCVLAWFIMNAIDANKFAEDMFGVATFTSNIIFWLQNGYFETSSTFLPLLHTWSLAVEEQYYVLFPLFLIIINRLGRNKFWTFLTIGLLSFVLAEWSVDFQSRARVASGAFYLLPTRGWELLLGSIVSLILLRGNIETTIDSKNLLSSLGLLMIVIPFFIYDSKTPFPGKYALLPTLGTLMVILYADMTTWSGRLLSSKPLVFVGLISYSLYLWHQPIFAFYRYSNKSVELTTKEIFILIATTVFLSYCTWKFVETPFRKKMNLSNKKIFCMSICALASLSLIALITSNATKDFEAKLAKELSRNNYVYFGNMDERRFTAARLNYPNNNPSSLIVGSSRIMQVNQDTTGEKSLNLSVSGASIEDIVALGGEGVARYGPTKIYIAGDPWIFNDRSGQNRWKSIDQLVSYWVEQIKHLHNHNYRVDQSGLICDVQYGLFSRLFEIVNRSPISAHSSDIEDIAKKAIDGCHIYSRESQQKTAEEIRSTFNSVLKYSMAEYLHSDKREKLLTDFILFLKSVGLEVYLVLSPYHPELYHLMMKDFPQFPEVETRLRMLASKLDVVILGSYDPTLVTCDASEFYDGMHPKKSCMEKVFRTHK